MVILFVERISFARPRKKRGNWSFEGKEVIYLGRMVEDSVKREAERVIMRCAHDCLPERAKRTVDNVSILLDLYFILLASLEVGKALVTSLVRASFGDTEVIRTHSFHRYNSFLAPSSQPAPQLPASSSWAQLAGAVTALEECASEPCVHGVPIAHLVDLAPLVTLIIPQRAFSVNRLLIC